MKKRSDGPCPQLRLSATPFFVTFGGVYHFTLEGISYKYGDASIRHGKEQLQRNTLDDDFLILDDDITTRILKPF